MLKRHILYDSNCITFWKRKNYGYQKKNQGCQGLEYKELMNSQGTKDFQVGENTLCNIIMRAIYDYTFILTHRMHYIE